MFEKAKSWARRLKLDVMAIYIAGRDPRTPWYAKQCASCHGAQGMGDGEAGRGLSPSPALLAYMIQMPMSVDEYMLWTISDGGKEFGTAMPDFKDKLSEEEIWQIVAFMRSGFPEMKSEQLDIK